MAVFSIKERKLKLDKAEDCLEILGQLNNGTQYEKIELNGNTISAPAAVALAEAFSKQTDIKVIIFFGLLSAACCGCFLKLLLFPPISRPRCG